MTAAGRPSRNQVSGLVELCHSSIDLLKQFQLLLLGFGIKSVLDVDDFNRFDYGLAGGIGVDFDGVMIGARYNYGMKEVGESGSLSGDLTDDSKNSVTTFYVAFSLR